LTALFTRPTTSSTEKPPEASVNGSGKWVAVGVSAGVVVIVLLTIVLVWRKKKMKRRTTINPGLENLPEEPIVMESYRAGMSRERQRAWEIQTEN